MSFHWLIVAYTVAVVSSSMIFEKSSSPCLLLLSGIFYIFTQLPEKTSRASLIIQPILMASIHWFSGTDMALALYVTQLARYFMFIRNIMQASIVSLLFIGCYAVIAIYDVQISWLELYTIVFQCISCYILAFLLYKYLHMMRSQTQQLDQEKMHLTTHDKLTGLVNFEEFHRRLERMVREEQNIVLILLDCKDLKSLNTTNGFEGVNKLLVQLADLLDKLFPDASIIARYGGDEFAVVLKADDPKAGRTDFTKLLEAEFPKQIGIQVTCGTAQFPSDAATKDDLIMGAEKNLFMMKRAIWLKQEEHMFRSEKLRVVGELASSMAHEIRNPLTAVKGFLQISKANRYSIEQWYDLIMKEIDRMSLLTGEFLQFSKPYPKQYTIGSLDQCVMRTVSLSESEAIRLSHSLIFHQEENNQLFVRMDPDKIIQVLLNLVKNAFEAMSTPGVVSIRLFKLHDYAVLEVRDTGVGMTEEELEQIYIPFYTTKESGTGLGLAICHRIIQDHGGMLKVSSTKFVGSTFTITLPLSPVET
jgi:diguanylate cyclase (GGDEF)-like protein